MATLVPLNKLDPHDATKSITKVQEQAEIARQNFARDFEAAVVSYTEPSKVSNTYANIKLTTAIINDDAVTFKQELALTETVKIPMTVYIAIRYGRSKMLDQLINAGFPIDIPLEMGVNKLKISTLSIAAMFDRLSIIYLLLNHNYPPYQIMNALSTAIMCNYPDIMLAILNHYRQNTFFKQYRQHALTEAVRYENAELIYKIIWNGYVVTDKDINTALYNNAPNDVLYTLLTGNKYDGSDEQLLVVQRRKVKAL